MLRRLLVMKYVLIDSLDIDFPEGLVIITGQTGAGKSIIIDALSMVLGARTDSSVIGSSADNCVIEAEFDADSDDMQLRHMMDEADVEWDPDRIMIRRVVSRSGRSRAFLNDCPVPVQVLSSISSRLVDIHSQHQTLLLSDRRFQLSVLDSFAGNGGLLASFREVWDEAAALKAQIADVAGRIEKETSEKEYNESVFRQLDGARLRDGELEELEKEQKALANAEEIKEGAKSVSSLLKEAERCIGKISGYIPDAAALVGRIESCRLELDDIGGEISGLNSSIDVSPERLQAVDDRISQLYGLMQRYSCRSISELISYRDSLSASISGTAALQEKKAELEHMLAEAEKKLDGTAERIHLSRMKAAPALASSIQEKLHFLELPFSVFKVDVLMSEMTSSGRDTVTFLFSSSGKDPVDVAKCASGGELSRIMLSLKSVMAQFQKMPTMIFDEIDTGVSGSVADRMGTMICEMGKYMQVFAITHLPQVAAKGTAHYLVSKSIDPVSSKAETTIQKLSGEQRVLEVARMLSGSVLSDAAVANAKDLLKG